jgi:hypothetical protein
MAWIFETKCPRCGSVNKRYHQPWESTYTLPEIPICLGVTCECMMEYIAVANTLKCLGCKECTWQLRGYEERVVNITLRRR